MLSDDTDDVAWPPDPDAQPQPHNVNPIKQKQKKSKFGPQGAAPDFQISHKKHKEEGSGAPVAQSSNCLEGIVFAITGTHSMVRKALVDLIVAHGGSISGSGIQCVTLMIVECVRNRGY